MGDVFEAVTDFQDEEFSFEWRITSWSSLKRIHSRQAAFSPTFRRNDLEVKFEISFRNDPSAQPPFQFPSKFDPPQPQSSYAIAQPQSSYAIAQPPFQLSSEFDPPQPQSASPANSNEPVLEYSICLLTPVEEGKTIILSSSCLLHGKNGFNFEHRHSSNHNRVMDLTTSFNHNPMQGQNRNIYCMPDDIVGVDVDVDLDIHNKIDFKAGEIRESDIKGQHIKLEAHFVVYNDQPTISENCQQVKENVCISTDSDKQLCEDFAKLIVSSLHSDIKIRVQNSVFKGHKAIFAARSPVFAAMFEHPMEEKSSACVNIKDTDAATWQRFQDFVYSGRVSLEECSVEEHGNILGLADKYQVKTLFDRVADELKKIANLDNFFDAFDIACKFDLSEVQLHLTNIYRRNRDHFTSEAARSEMIERMTKNPKLLNIVCGNS